MFTVKSDGKLFWVETPNGTVVSECSKSKIQAQVWCNALNTEKEKHNGRPV
jgi:hypothetical protein